MAPSLRSFSVGQAAWWNSSGEGWRDRVLAFICVNATVRFLLAGPIIFLAELYHLCFGRHAAEAPGFIVVNVGDSVPDESTLRFW